MLTVDDVREALGLDPADTADEEWLAGCTAAANAYVNGLPVVVDSADPSTWSDAVIQGAKMLAVHLYQFRGAPYGRAVLNEAGAYQTAYAHPEIARLLQLRRWARPSIAGAP